MNREENIIIAAGGSGGHLFPALSLADRLKEKGREVILLISSKDIDKKISALRNYRLEIFSLPPFSFRKSHFFLIKFGKSLLLANEILHKYKPAAVVGFGGYNTIPILLVSALKKIPTLIHEQNVLPGMANRILSKFVSKIAIGFYCTEKFFPSKKVIFSGNPLRKEIFERSISEKFKKKFQSKFIILIMGGSQGAHRINTVVLNTLKEMPSSEKNSLAIIHLCGVGDYSFLKEKYSQLGVAHSLFSFFDKMGSIYAVADLVISRAGAISISEIIALKRAALLIPYPYARLHQKANAKFLFQQNACLMIEEKDFTSQYLKKIILKFKKNRESLLAIKRNIGQLVKVDADKLLEKEVIKLTEKRK